MNLKRLRADDEARTRDLNLGKVALYQLSYIRILFLISSFAFVVANIIAYRALVQVLIKKK